jgi:hypothetical protein
MTEKKRLIQPRLCVENHYLSHFHWRQLCVTWRQCDKVPPGVTAIGGSWRQFGGNVGTFSVPLYKGFLCRLN